MSKHIKESKKQKVISEFIKADKNNIDALMKVLNNDELKDILTKVIIVNLTSLSQLFPSQNEGDCFLDSVLARAKKQSRDMTNYDEPLDCYELFDCCSCGDNDCGCRYCFDCNACDSCKDDHPENCEHTTYNE
jgi:hypothetical protein